MLKGDIDINIWDGEFLDAVVACQQLTQVTSLLKRMTCDVPRNPSNTYIRKE